NTTVLFHISPAPPQPCSTSDSQLSPAPPQTHTSALLHLGLTPQPAPPRTHTSACSTSDSHLSLLHLRHTPQPCSLRHTPQPCSTSFLHQTPVMHLVVPVRDHLSEHILEQMVFPEQQPDKASLMWRR
ncbi:hypothetical protein WMY93_026220, partial [Mugilogobius chulae]